ncbi:MAG: hypothetical protein ACR2FS_14495 [Phormidesmis sp.]
MKQRQLLWTQALRRWQTIVLLGSVGLGYFLLLVATNFRTVAWGLGGLVAIAMLISWFQQFWMIKDDADPPKKTDGFE